MDNTDPFEPGQPASFAGVDGSPLPAWGKASDGRSVKIEADEQMRAAYAAWRADACQHPRQFTGKIINAGGSPMYARYCRDCGEKTTEWLPHATIAGTTVTQIDAEKREGVRGAYRDARQAALDVIANEAAERQQPALRAEYGAYLQTPQWRDLRARVLKRAGGTCEGCLNARATQVHHLTYADKGDEFAFQLVAVCDACHDRLHGGALSEAA